LTYGSPETTSASNRGIFLAIGTGIFEEAYFVFFFGACFGEFEVRVGDFDLAMGYFGVSIRLPLASYFSSSSSLWWAALLLLLSAIDY
jgi:hypothetical protein